MQRLSNFIIPVLSILLVGFTRLTIAQKLAPGPQVMTFYSSVDDTEQPYGLYLPKNYNPKKKYPFVMMLHGAGSNHRLALKRAFGKSNAPGETDVETSRYFPEWADVNYIVAAPLARGTMGYQGIAEKDVMDILADVKKRFNVDEDRTYLTGLSMGGGGTLWIGLTRPDIWAAIAPVCPAPPQGTDTLAGNALNVPAHFFHGDKDQAVPVAVSRNWVKKLKELGSQVEYVEYPGVNHNSWENAYKDEFIFGWFNQFKRNRFPDRVWFASSRYKYNSAYWVRFDELTSGTLATVDAKFTDRNRLEISTGNLTALTLRLAGHTKFKANRPLEITIDAKTITVQVSDSITLVQRNGSWIADAYQPALTAKKPGSEGPLSEAFASRHVYVYGTAGNPSPDELKARMDVATQAANWAVDRGAFLGRIMVFPRVLADKEVRPSDLESANLVLFGTKETNTLIDKYSGLLPIQLSGPPSEYGLFYVFPVGGHYVAINSGLPWWGDPNQAQGIARVMPKALGTPLVNKDFVLFKGSPKNIIADGDFDKNWQLTGADAQKLKSSEAVIVPGGAVSSAR